MWRVPDSPITMDCANAPVVLSFSVFFVPLKVAFKPPTAE
jgi:hypothetical protein